MTGLDNIFNRVKEATKQAADQTNRAAKAAKLKMNVMSLTAEKTQHLQTIGQRTYTLFVENSTIDGRVLQEKIQEELTQIERIDGRIRELEAEIADIQANTQHVDITDVTAEGKEKAEREKAEREKAEREKADKEKHDKSEGNQSKGSGASGNKSNSDNKEK